MKLRADFCAIQTHGKKQKYAGVIWPMEKLLPSKTAGLQEGRKSGMNMEDKIARINELYRKSQTEGLTREEKTEQAQLRGEYVASVRANLRGQLDNIVIEHPDGSREKLSHRRGRSL